jgi:hypothetical protein
MKVVIATHGNWNKSSQVFIDDKSISSAKEACRIIEAKSNLSLPTTGDSAVRILYNMAIDQGFTLYWDA